MRGVIIVLCCALIASLAFAQTKTKKSRQTTSTQTTTTEPTVTQMTTGAVQIGTVTSFTPGQVTYEPASPIVVQSGPDTRPVSYILGRKAHFVDKDGRAVDPNMVRPGTRVHLDFDRRGRVSRVVVVEK